jgi:glycosyltransferase involved in cell wall biosynthesis
MQGVTMIAPHKSSESVLGASGRSVEFTILMPCLNEAETIAACIGKAVAYLNVSGIAGEVLIADNGSTDGSQQIAAAAGARVIAVPRRGYGAALMAGISAAHGHYIIMGDADDSYDFCQLQSFIDALRSGAELVMGNRFKGGIAPGAMPFLHRYLGNPVLSMIGRVLFATRCGDFHCGLRGFVRSSILALDLNTTGMEFATEMVVRAVLHGLRVTEVPTTLSQAGRSRPAHLRTWRDGWRHLRFMLIYSPRWLYLYPGIALILIGMLVCGLLLPGPLELTPRVSLDIHTFLVACVSMQLGMQSIVFALVVRRYSTLHGLLPRSGRYGDVLDWLSLERLLLIALVLIVPGICGLSWALFAWSETGFGLMQYTQWLRVMILSLTGISCGLELAFTAFLLGIMETPRRIVNSAPRKA